MCHYGVYWGRCGCGRDQVDVTVVETGVGVTVVYTGVDVTVVYTGGCVTVV